MGHKVKEKKKIEAAKYAGSKLSMNIGISSWGVLFAAMIKDAAQLFLGTSLLRDVIIGFLALMWAIIVFRFNLSEKVSNGDNMRWCIDFCTLCSVILFFLENVMFPIAQGIEKVVAVVFILVYIGLNIGIAVWTFCLKKDRHYKVD